MVGVHSAVVHLAAKLMAFTRGYASLGMVDAGKADRSRLNEDLEEDTYS